jgi:glutaredoxin 3
VVDSVGAWLVSHPAPLWLVNNPIKRWFTTATAGDYDREAAAAELDAKIGSDGVVLFSATYCPFSRRVKQELSERCIPFTVYETNVLPSGPALVAELGRTTGRTSIPALFIAGVSIGGCNDGTPGLRPLISSGGLPAALAKCSPEFSERRRLLQEERKCTTPDTA